MKTFFNAVFVLAVVMVLPTQFLFGQEKISGSIQLGELKMKPIVVEYHTVDGLQYSIDGRYLIRYQDFEDLVFPLRDFQMERLLKKSETADLDSKIFSWAGFAGLATGVVGLLTSSSNRQPPFWASAVGGAILIDVGGLFQSEAQTTKFNCVQRYNRFARGEEQVLPQGPSDEKSLLNFNRADQLATPKKESPKAQ